MITSHTEKLALIGSPIRHSKSPEIMNSVFKEMGLNCTYIAFDVSEEKLLQAVQGLQVLGFKGWNVTIPHKVEIIKYLDGIDENAMEIGAVNTVVCQEGKYIGCNTDGKGYLRSLNEDFSLDFASQQVVILGAGGAARSVGYVLARQGVRKITFANRTLSKAEDLAKKYGNYTITDAVDIENCYVAIEKSTLLINATSVGMHPNVSDIPIDPNFLHANLIVSDLVYNPKETTLLKSARKKGARLHYGSGMLLYQAVIALELWTGITPPMEKMRRVLNG